MTSGKAALESSENKVLCLAEAGEDAQSEKHMVAAPGSLEPTLPVVAKATSASVASETVVALETETDLLRDMPTPEISILPLVTIASVASPVAMEKVLPPVSETVSSVSTSVFRTVDMEMGSTVSKTVAVESLVLSSKCQTSLAASLPSIVTMLSSPAKQPVSVLPATATQPLLMVPQEAVDAKVAVTVALTPQAMLRGIDRIVSHSIPCVVSDDGNGRRPMVLSAKSDINPQLWSVFEVCQFLRINDSGAFCEGFRRKVEILPQEVF